MFTGIIEYLHALILNLGAFGVFLGVVIEEIVAPIPSAVVTMGAALILIPSDLNLLEAVWLIFWKIAVPASAGMVVGSSFIYGIGYWGGKLAVIKWGKWFGITWQGIEKSEKKLAKKNADILMLLFFRTIPIIPSVVLSAFYGIIRVRWTTYAVVTFFGSLVKSMALGLIGWKAQGAYTLFADQFKQLEDFIIATIVVIAIIGLGWLLRKNIKKTNN